MNCPHQHHNLRKDLPPLTPRLAKLPVDERGYPVPFFVAWIDGKPEFRAADPDKLIACIKHRLCWVCGELLGKDMAFVIGPMCAINRINAEPPSHPDCAHWSVRGCPFLARPNMVRREDDFTRENEDNIAGLHIKRNPGVMLIWTTLSYTLQREDRGVLFNIGDPKSVSFWREGRPATRAEILESIETGLPKLLEVCGSDAERKELYAARDEAMKLVPN